VIEFSADLQAFEVLPLLPDTLNEIAIRKNCVAGNL